MRNVLPFLALSLGIFGEKTSLVIGLPMTTEKSNASFVKVCERLNQIIQVG